MPVHSDHTENEGCPNIVADESRGVWRAKVAGVLVMFVLDGAPLPEGGEELRVREVDPADER